MLLAQPVQTSSLIVRLDLSFNWLGPDCIGILVDGLKNSPLAELLLTGNRLGGDDSARLTRATCCHAEVRGRVPVPVPPPVPAPVPVVT